MEECDICLTKKKRNKNKHEHSKKYKNFSNLIIKKYIVESPEIVKFKDIVQPNYDKQKKKFDDFTVCIRWKKDEVVIKKISVSSITKKRRI